MTILEFINNSRDRNQKLFGLLLDPESYSKESLIEILHLADESDVDIILVGGSLISKPIDEFTETIKKHSNIPVVLFPGSLIQLTDKADGILLLSLISGRNPDFLIGNHVIAAPYLSKTKMEKIPTGYILIGGQSVSAVEYMSNTNPIPPNKTELVVSTAQAGELLGMKALYLEGGSGASEIMNTKIIEEVRKNINIPLICGGGVRTKDDVRRVLNAGADMIVVGNMLEEKPGKLNELVQAAHEHHL